MVGGGGEGEKADSLENDFSGFKFLLKIKVNGAVIFNF